VEKDLCKHMRSIPGHGRSRPSIASGGDPQDVEVSTEAIIPPEIWDAGVDHRAPSMGIGRLPVIHGPPRHLLVHGHWAWP